MDPQWDDSQPIYRQLRDRVVAMILEGVLKEGDPLPSVRAVAAEFRLNPLTVLKGYQQLVDEQLVEKKRGRGMFVNDGARQALMKDERSVFPRNGVAEDLRDDRAARPHYRRTHETQCEIGPGVPAVPDCKPNTGDDDDSDN